MLMPLLRHFATAFADTDISLPPPAPLMLRLRSMLPFRRHAELTLFSRLIAATFHDIRAYATFR